MSATPLIGDAFPRFSEADWRALAAASIGARSLDTLVSRSDDGIAVGSTLAAAVSAARQGGAARVVVGVPVASVDGAARIRAVADELVALATPEWFMGVGEWYEDFGQVSDEEVRRLLEREVPTKASGQATEPLG